MNIVIINKDEEIKKTVECCFVEREDITSVTWFNESQKALDFLAQNVAEMVFVDKESLSVTLSEFLQKLTHKIAIVLCSGNSTDAVEAFDLGLEDFLLKPITIARCTKAILKVKKQVVKAKENPFEVFFIKVNNQILRLRFDEIYYIEADGDYVSINTYKNKFVVNMGLGVMEEILKGKPFARIHRSFIVAIDKIEKIVDNKVTINNAKIPVGNSYKSDFLSKLNIVY